MESCNTKIYSLNVTWKKGKFRQNVFAIAKICTPVTNALPAVLKNMLVLYKEVCVGYVKRGFIG